MKRIRNVFRGFRHRLNTYLPRLEAEGIVIMWRRRIADAYAAFASEVSSNKDDQAKYKGKRPVIITHMDFVTDMMLAQGYAADNFRVIDLSETGPICEYHGMTVRCDPKQKDVKLVRVEVEDAHSESKD